jgi:hypothetical protein
MELKTENDQLTATVFIQRVVQNLLLLPPSEFPSAASYNIANLVAATIPCYKALPCTRQYKPIASLD